MRDLGHGGPERARDRGGKWCREKSDEWRGVSEVPQISLSSLWCHIASQDVIYFSTVMRIPSHTKEV